MRIVLVVVGVVAFVVRWWFGLGLVDDVGLIMIVSGLRVVALAAEPTVVVVVFVVVTFAVVGAALDDPASGRL